MMNSNNYMIPNPIPVQGIPIAQNLTAPAHTAIGLKQIQDFEMPRDFTDSNGKSWKLVKSAHDSSVEIPDPQYVQITDYWNHEFPGSEGKVYIYVVEGIKRPRIDTERSVNVLYQWFSTANNPSFTPQSITPAEWYNANVYTSPITDARVSKLRALCNIAEDKQTILQNAQDKDISLSLIGRGVKDNGNNRTGTATRSNAKSN